ncbi:MAG: UDP-N-acetylglucosamine--N-acetylmuramyl-(pentapeptide) pyrophosphoryl-undecaprenol N-acetylglucosamine transferase [Thermotogota bacterium]|nr:UDP-N-acetylglucosamine--N-acetylmuramyl-(pentapeptide) pyrophosphoryl-undecaprenol N-acetylglucosamine transferase [Thermotogota bacterium]
MSDKGRLRIAVCGGGTGGHYYPLVSVINALKKVRELEVLYYTSKGRLDDRYAERDIEDVKKIPLDVKGLKRPLYSPKNAVVIFNHLVTTKMVKKSMNEFSPDLVFSTGGYISFPVVKAASKIGLPVFLHEQNSIPGIANQKLAHYAKKVFISFEKSKNYFKNIENERIILTGNPVREVKKSKKEVYDSLGIGLDKKLVVICGGSQGSDFINGIMTEIYNGMKDDRYFFYHITGNADTKINVYPFVKTKKYNPQLNEFMAVADCVVARGGATTIAELAHYDTPGVIIPWSEATENHQYFNGLRLQEMGLGYVILENAVTSGGLLKTISKISTNYRPKLKNKKEPAETIARHLLQEE